MPFFNLINKTMKYIGLFSFILALHISYCQGQNHGRAYYLKMPTQSFKSGIDSINKSNPNNPLKGVQESLSGLEFILKFNNKLAAYQENQLMLSDFDNQTTKKLGLVLSGYRGPSFYDFKNQIILNKREFMGNVYLVLKPLENTEWILSKEKIILNGLTCYKATTKAVKEGRNGKIAETITAWYTIDINISAGPDGYGGLPGLIVQVQDDKFITTLKKIELQKSSENIELPSNGTKISDEEFNELVKKKSYNAK